MNRRHRGQARLHRLRRDHADVLVAHRRRLLGREDHVRVVRQDEHVVRRHGLDRVEDVLRGRVHRLAALDDARRAEALEQPPVARARDRRRRDRSRASRSRSAPPPSSSRSSRCAVWWCMFAISTPSTTPTAVPSVSACPGSSVCTCTLSARRVADDEERVADLLELRLERVLVERVRPRRRTRCSSGTRRAPGGSRRSRTPPRRPAPPGAPRRSRRRPSRARSRRDRRRPRRRPRHCAGRRAARSCARRRPRPRRARPGAGRWAGRGGAPSSRSPRPSRG